MVTRLEAMVQEALDIVAEHKRELRPPELIAYAEGRAAGLSEAINILRDTLRAHESPPEPS